MVKSVRKSEGECICRERLTGGFDVLVDAEFSVTVSGGVKDWWPLRFRTTVVWWPATWLNCPSKMTVSRPWRTALGNTMSNQLNVTVEKDTLRLWWWSSRFVWLSRLCRYCVPIGRFKVNKQFISGIRTPVLTLQRTSRLREWVDFNSSSMTRNVQQLNPT